MKEPARAPLQYSEIARRYAEEKLNGRLLEHTRECAETAQKIARKFGADVEKTLAASYLHDIAKVLSRKKLLAMAREMGMSDVEIDSCPPPVLHGPVGALIARKELAVDDVEILQAIEAHSTGCAGMCKVAKIVFIADYIELTRSFPGASSVTTTTLRQASALRRAGSFRRPGCIARMPEAIPLRSASSYCRGGRLVD